MHHHINLMFSALDQRDCTITANVLQLMYCSHEWQHVAKAANIKKEIILKEGEMPETST